VKRTQVDPKKLKLKRKAVAAISDKKLQDVTGGAKHGGGHFDPNGCGIDPSRLCPKW